MSQEKVDKYKEEKKNRKAQIEKEKKRKKLWKVLGPVLAIVMIAAIGAGIYYMPRLTNKASQDSAGEEIDMDALMEMINSSLSDNDASGEEVPADQAPADDAITE